MSFRQLFTNHKEYISNQIIIIIIIIKQYKNAIGYSFDISFNVIKYG